ncbi:MAG: energy-coupling factor transporter ATPase [Clostridiales bacterium]|jgi:energy-coupling factor transport system ATP-binding protein|nr:energy-coupling factor transporter ATPase [Clostridiales bacterium]
MITTERLQFKYSEEREEEALRDVSVTIQDGEFVAVLGHNGSGKSTFAKHLNAILLPVGGTVYVDGIDTKDERRLYDIRQAVGMVFQNPDNQIVATVVEEDVAFAPENLGVPSAEIRKVVDWALETVGMGGYKRHAPHLLSGGQKQRVAIAGVLAMKPRCIVLDEPTAMLDPIGRREVVATLRRLNKEEGMTIVLITHNMDEAVSADRVVVMSGGGVVLDDTPRKVFADVARIKALGLDVPQVTELMYELRREGLDVPTEILTVDEAYQALKCRCISGVSG